MSDETHPLHPPLPKSRVRYPHVITATRERREGGQTVGHQETVEELPMPPAQEMFADPPAFVSVKAGATLGTGTQFEFVRVDVGITRPCENTDEAIHAAYEDVSTKVRHYVRVELDAALGVNQQPTSPLANG